MIGKLRYYLGFSYMPGIGPTKFDLLIKNFNSVDEAYKAPTSQIINILGSSLGSKFILFRSTFDFESEYKNIVKDGITVLTREDERYPDPLREISDSPICLYVKGDLTPYKWDKDFFFAIVGTRKPTEYGKQVTRKFSRELAETGAVIVSGMAMGVDSIAHWAAIDAGKRTIAFLGCGVNIIYPSINRPLYYKIIENGGLIISEFPPNKTTMVGHFIARNRLISGLSKGILVSEGLIDSGSLITARYALAQGKDVFAPPSPITSEQSNAPNMLIKDGAKMVTDVNDILEEYEDTVKQIKAHDMSQKLSEEEKNLFQLLSQEAFTTDELARTLKVPVYQLLSVLSSMELSGLIEKNASGRYQIRL